VALSFCIITRSRYGGVLTNSALYCLILVQSLLDDIRAHRIPVDFLELFNSAGVPFYDGVYLLFLPGHIPYVQQVA
jgi:hypothetical protein